MKIVFFFRDRQMKPEALQWFRAAKLFETSKAAIEAGQVAGISSFNPFPLSLSLKHLSVDVKSIIDGLATLPVAEDPLFPQLVHIDTSLPSTPTATRSLVPTAVATPTQVATPTRIPRPTQVPTPTATPVQPKVTHSAPVVQATPQPEKPVINEELEKKRVGQFAELEAKLMDQMERWKVKALVRISHLGRGNSL